MESKCLYCKRDTPQGKKFCGKPCREHHSEMLKAQAAIREGRLCQRCNKPILGRGNKFCSQVCQRAHQNRPKICPICMVVFHGAAKFCSKKCSMLMQKRKIQTDKTYVWLRTRRNQPDLELVPTATSLYRRPIETACGLPVAIRCWQDSVTDFPKDTAAYAVIWRDEKNVYCQARRPKIAREALLRLPLFEIEIMNDTVVKRSKR